MRRLIKKWGESVLAVLCLLAIVFAALYTRQDDLRRMAAENAAASQDQTLTALPASLPWGAPTSGGVLIPFATAGKSGGIWRFSPYVRWAAEAGESVRAMAAGTVLRVGEDAVRLAHADDTQSGYRGLGRVRVRPGQAVEAGEALGTAGTAGWVEVCLCCGGEYIDPQNKITGP